MAPSSPLKAAVVGVGTMGRNHARVYAELPDVELCAVADADAGVARTLAGQLGCAHYTDVTTLLDARAVDIVSVVVPTSLHDTVAIETVRRGVATLVEKPLARSADVARRIIDTAESAGALLMVGHIERFNPAVTELKKIVELGQLGDIVSVMTRRVGVAPPRITDCGVVIDLAVHDIDVCNHLLGRLPDAVYAVGGDAITDGREDYAELLLRYGRTSASIQVNWITPVKVRVLNITGTHGYAELDFISQALTLHHAAPHNTYEDYGDFISKFAQPLTLKVEVTQAEPLRMELEHFVAAVRAGGPSPVPGADGLAALEVALDAEAQLQDRTDE